MKATGAPLIVHDEEVKSFGNEAFDNMGGNAEDLAFRPMHVKPFYVWRTGGFLYIIGG